MGCLEAPQINPKTPSLTRKEKGLAAVGAQLPTNTGCLEAPQKRPSLTRKEKGSVGPAVAGWRRNSLRKRGVSRHPQKAKKAVLLKTFWVDSLGSANVTSVFR